MVPSTGRGLAFVTMFALSTIHVIVKTLASALLIVTNSNWFVYFMVGDMGIYLTQKAVRKDFVYWVPMKGKMMIPISLFVRVITKLISDFSGTLMFRNALELGGIWFSLNLVITQVSAIVSTYLYNEHYEGTQKLDATLLWVVVLSAFCLWLATFSFFLFYVIVPKYRKTFYSTQTGWQKTQGYFLDNEGDDEMRCNIFGDNIHNWRSIEEEVKTWSLASWAKWEAEKPPWFTAARKAEIPDDFIPALGVAALGGVKRERRGSARFDVVEAVDLKRRLSQGAMLGVGKLSEKLGDVARRNSLA
jgi:hypothetical protein